MKEVPVGPVLEVVLFGEKKKELLVLFRGVFLEKRRWLLDA